MTTTPTSGAADLPAIISGALFDFAGFLTTLDKSRAVTFSGAHEAGPAVTLLQEWSTKRGLNLDEADVSGWSSALTAQAISKAPDHVAEVGNMVEQAISAEPAPSGASHEQALEEALRERDEADDFIDTLLDEVLGPDRAEWSSAYGRAEAMEEVRERITALHKPAVDRAWTQFAAADSVPAEEREKERIAFKDAHRHLELDEVSDAWGRPMFKHSHVETSWLGWIARAVLTKFGNPPAA